MGHLYHCYVSHNQRVHHIKSHSTTILDPIKSHHISPNVFHIYIYGIITILNG